MKPFKTIFLPGLALVLSLFATTWVDGSTETWSQDELRQEFETLCPKPKWWDRVPITDVKIYTYDELLKYWQDKNRTDSQFFKAAYQAILDYPDDLDIVVNAIKFMYYTYSYPHRIELQEYAIEKYFSYRGPYGKAGDTIAGIVENLVKLYNDLDQYDKTIGLIERLLNEREPEINDHILELLHLEYAEALHGLNRKDEAIRTLETAVKKYDGSWEKRLNEAIAHYQGRPQTEDEKPTVSPQSQSAHKMNDRREKGELWLKNNLFTIGLSIVAVALFLNWLHGSRHQTDRSSSYPPRGSGTDADVERLVRQGQKISAIKLHREIHRVGLKEAKEAVEQIQRRAGRR